MTSGSSREELYDVFSEPDRDVEAKIRRALAIGTTYLDLPIGLFSRIEDGVQEVVCATGSYDAIQPGETCPLEQSFCRQTVELDGALAVHDIGNSTIEGQPVEVFDLDAYIGAKVVVNDEVYGTVCFAARERRDRSFSESEELFIELFARLVGSELERRAYERDLRERSERLEREKRLFEGISDTSFDVLFRVDLEARFTYVSSAVERVLGYPPEDLTGEPFYEFMTDAAAEDAAAAYATVLGGDHVEHLELDFVDQDGSLTVLAVNATPITNDGVVGVQGVGRDVTSRKERERELSVKTRAMDGAAAGISIADPNEPEQPLVYVNEGFERITGYDASDALGRNCRFLQGDATDPETVARLRAAIEAEAAVSVELINYRYDGTPFWNQVRLDPVFDDEGALSHYLGFQADVTKRRRTERLVQLLNRVLRHNLRNDVTALDGWTDRLRETDDVTDDPHARIDRILQEMLELSEQARELERHAQSDREPRRIDTTGLVSDLAAAHRDRFPNATIGVDVRTEHAICAGPEVGDAISELLENAVKHDSSDAPQVDVTVTESDDGEWVDVIVTDHGPGIDEMEAEVVSSGIETQVHHGSGLGLWLVNWIVTRYGGSFHVESVDVAETEGTVATVRLPSIDEDTSVDAVERGPTVLFH